MYEYIFPGLTLDEAKAFAGVEPLYCSLFFAHFVILFSLKKLSGAPLTETRVSGFVLQTLRYKNSAAIATVPLGAPAVFSCFSVLPLSGHKKKAASLTRDRFTTSKAIQEQQTHSENNIGRR